MVEVKLCDDENYMDLVEGREEEIKSMYSFIYRFIEDYIVQCGLGDKVKLSTRVLDHVVVDYFVDMDRLKPFQKIEYANEHKIHAYIAYWLLRHKPIQLIEEIEEQSLAFINEDLTTHFLISFLIDESTPIANEKRQDLYEFFEAMKYNFCYRNFSAQSIELMLMAFRAGQGYQYSIDYMK